MPDISDPGGYRGPATLDGGPGRGIQVVSSAPLATIDDELSVEQLVSRVRKVKDVHSKLMVEGEHYGKIPGAGDKPTLFKVGAELLGLAFRLDPQFDIAEKTYDEGHLTVVIKCTLYHAPTGSRLGSGLGSCSTRESKYAYRKGERVCPKCEKATIRKSKNESEGWYCWRKIDGCGATFQPKDPAIIGQQVGRVPNPDLADQYNTVLKMATKRAHVAATLFVTGASEIFTQDLEDAAEPEEQPEPPRKPGSGAAGPGTRISPHDHPDAPDDPAQELDGVFSGMMRELHDLEQAIAKVSDYGEALTLKTLLGTLAVPSELTKRIQRARETQQIGGEQHKELSRQWQKNGRALNKRLKELEPDALSSFTDPGDPEGDREGGL
jgi:hypothetical protein